VTVGFAVTGSTSIESGYKEQPFNPRQQVTENVMSQPLACLEPFCSCTSNVQDISSLASLEPFCPRTSNVHDFSSDSHLLLTPQLHPRRNLRAKHEIRTSIPVATMERNI
jgi:hypothetical protein